MLSTDRDEFDAQVATLCAGHNVPATPERKDAFWIGMGKMSLIEFTRCVEFALSEQGPEKFPSTKVLWRLHREIKSSSRATTQQVIHRGEQQDHLLYYGNRMFLRHVAYRGGSGSTARLVPGYELVECKPTDELRQARAALHDTVNWFCGPIREGDPDATPHAFMMALIKAIDAVSPINRAAIVEWEQMLGHVDAHRPFPAFMGRDLPAEEPRQLAMA